MGKCVLKIDVLLDEIFNVEGTADLKGTVEAAPGGVTISFIE
jgi:hypothetical protein